MKAFVRSILAAAALAGLAGCAPMVTQSPGQGLSPVNAVSEGEDEHLLLFGHDVVSYFTENNTGADFGPSYPGTVMLDDIAAAQRTYGVNTTTRTGDTVYGFNSNADRPWFIATSATTRLKSTSVNCSSSA